MKELFEKFLMQLCLFGIGMIAVAAFVRYMLPTVSQKTKAATEALRRNGVIAAFIAVVFVCGMIVYGSTKNNTPSNDPPAQAQVLSNPAVAVEALPAHIEGAIVRAGHQAVSPSPVPSNALGRVEKWWRRGALNDGHIVTFDDDWRFPHGTNHLASIEVWSSGAVYASAKDPTPIAELVAKLSLAPHDTEVFAGRTTNNTYRIEWHGGHPNRDPSQTADASIELFRNGNVIVAESGVSVAIPYSIPFPHDGYGQDEVWVRANFTNADEILSIGYRQWVERQVGVGLANGLYQFSAEFLVDPPEPTELFWRRGLSTSSARCRSMMTLITGRRTTWRRARQCLDLCGTAGDRRENGRLTAGGTGCRFRPFTSGSTTQAIVPGGRPCRERLM